MDNSGQQSNSTQAHSLPLFLSALNRTVPRVLNIFSVCPVPVESFAYLLHTIINLSFPPLFPLFFVVCASSLHSHLMTS